MTDLFQYVTHLKFDLSPRVYMVVIRTDKGWMAHRNWHSESATDGGMIIPDEIMAADFAGYHLSRDGWATPPPTSPCDNFYFPHLHDLLNVAGWEPARQTRGSSAQ